MGLRWSAPQGARKAGHCTVDLYLAFGVFVASTTVITGFPMFDLDIPHNNISLVAPLLCCSLSTKDAYGSCVKKRLSSCVMTHTGSFEIFRLTRCLSHSSFPHVIIVFLETFHRTVHAFRTTLRRDHIHKPTLPSVRFVSSFLRWETILLQVLSNHRPESRNRTPSPVYRTPPSVPGTASRTAENAEQPRWSPASQPNLVTGAVHQQQPQSRLPRRGAKQILESYVTHLNPKVRRSTWFIGF